ncbi:MULTISPECIES: [FeFe] hydrogenase H-cluster radical SAM maturase HydE [Caproicibacterium]|uniref:[FeFe] hydrogenase H-cluster radical SAM maturase HydE n=1 Tax=Caproicibacterium argilliputei TaxID=3030016 RepID=A0AA97D8Y3_9FIRM|nr:[FeFe] hydrogenase H-cluster radical SAM maturase HydE [Caproicibacterium argilliputei]WOC31484.1 [FeFe] hydrogenase H-cluster radical SAM maturase HydE [Caproicibacterium argilliputei]
MNTASKKLIDTLAETHTLGRQALLELLQDTSAETAQYLFAKARNARHRVYGHDVYMRGLIEFTNFCKNDCYYCGIRRSNAQAQRYRLTPEQILECCDAGYELGFRTYVLQGGEDPYFTDERIATLVRRIKQRHPDCAVTLSIGEKSRESYALYRAAGADRYLLRHETANAAHYAKLHPPELSLENRKRCLRNLKALGYQVGCGFMVGSPYQTVECLAEDLLFTKELNPHMVGIGPFIPQHQTPFADKPAGTLEQTLFLLGVLRLLLPNVLLPATTALGTIHPQGRELGILAGANVVMPNLSPVSVRKKYMLYDNKICTGEEAAECRLCLARRMERIGYQLTVSRGDYLHSSSYSH